MKIKCNNDTSSILKLDEVFPINSIYISMNSTNPSQLLGGGTWTRIAKGQTLVGLDENDSDFKTAEKTGGEKSHQLTIDEMPSHNHEYYSPIVQSVVPGNSTLVYGNYNKQYIIGTSYTGGNGSHNNLQPYLVTYIWKRTA